jgi:DNA-binding transcriptional LysR family regulator
MRLPDFEAWGIFAAVADLGSFTAAASALSLSKATVSKAVTRLEQQLGAPLFHRTSRRLSLTQSGAKLVDHARRIRAEGEAAQEAARDEAVAPAGQIRLAVPLSFGLGRIAPLLADFLTANPAISIDLHLSDAQVDLIGEGYDLALRIARLPDSSLRARRLCAVRLHTLASPAYLAAHGEPRHPGQLGEHRCIAYAPGRNPQPWSFSGSDGSQVTVRAAGPLQVNNGDAMLPALCAGLGVAQLPDFIAEAEMAAGRLVPILADWSPPPLALYLLSPPGTLRTRRVSALADFLVARLASPAA